MNGIRYFLDTNAVITLLKGNDHIEQKLTTAGWIGLSVISILEFLAYPLLSSNDRTLLKKLINRVEVIGIVNDFNTLEHIASFKKRTRLKLPDAIIAATAMQQQAILITNDKHFTSISSLQTITY